MSDAAERKLPPYMIGLLVALTGGVIFATRVSWRPAPAPPVAGAFTSADADRLFSHRGGAVFQAQVLYHCFKLDRDPALSCPAWLDGELRKMTTVLFEEKDAALTEGDLWRAAPSTFYESFELTRRRFAPVHGGAEAPLAAVAAEHVDNAERCRIVADRLRTVPSAALAGRGTALIAGYSSACDAAARVAAAAKAGDEAAYRAAVLAQADAISAADAALRR